LEIGGVADPGPAVNRRCSDLRKRLADPGYPLDWRPRFADAYRLELGAWVASVAAGAASPLATAADGLAASRVAAAVITSMHESGRWVEVVR
jgi:myo-inositol 2-dehydrogenase/D-chiro-inositol 1-dehydrogenase